MLAAFSQVYSENHEQKLEQKCQFDQKKYIHVDKMAIIVNESRTIKKKLHALHWDNRKGILRYRLAH